MLQSVNASQASLASGVAADEDGHLLQVQPQLLCRGLLSCCACQVYAPHSSLQWQEWRPFNTRQWLGEYLLTQTNSQPAGIQDSTPNTQESQQVE